MHIPIDDWPLAEKITVALLYRIADSQYPRDAISIKGRVIGITYEGKWLGFWSIHKSDDPQLALEDMRQAIDLFCQRLIGARYKIPVGMLPKTPS